MSASKELKELSSPQIAGCSSVSSLKTTNAIIAIADLVTKIAEDAEMLNIPFLEAYNEKSKEEAAAQCLLLAINFPDTDTNDIYSSAMMRLMSWVSKVSSISIMTSSSAILECYGRTISRLAVAMVTSYIVSNFSLSNSVRIADDMLEILNGKLRALLYLVCCVSQEKYHDKSVVPITTIQQWIGTGYAHAINDRVPMADLDEIHKLITAPLAEAVMPNIKISEWMQMLQKITNKYKKLIAQYTNTTEFKLIVQTLLSNEFQGYLVASAQDYDPNTLWKVLKDKFENKFNYSLSTGNIEKPQLNITMAYQPIAQPAFMQQQALPIAQPGLLPQQQLLPQTGLLPQQQLLPQTGLQVAQPGLLPQQQVYLQQPGLQVTQPGLQMPQQQLLPQTGVQMVQPGLLPQQQMFQMQPQQYIQPGLNPGTTAMQMFPQARLQPAIGGVYGQFYR